MPHCTPAHKPFSSSVPAHSPFSPSVPVHNLVSSSVPAHGFVSARVPVHNPFSSSVPAHGFVSPSVPAHSPFSPSVPVHNPFSFFVLCAGTRLCLVQGADAQVHTGTQQPFLAALEFSVHAAPLIRRRRRARLQHDGAKSARLVVVQQFSDHDQHLPVDCQQVNQSTSQIYLLKAHHI